MMYGPEELSRALTAARRCLDQYRTLTALQTARRSLLSARPATPRELARQRRALLGRHVAAGLLGGAAGYSVNEAWRAGFRVPATHWIAIVVCVLGCVYNWAATMAARRRLSRARDSAEAVRVAEDALDDVLVEVMTAAKRGSPIGCESQGPLQ